MNMSKFDSYSFEKMCLDIHVFNVIGRCAFNIVDKHFLNLYDE